MKKVTLDDLAYKLNISKSLVSRALSDKYGVSSEMRTLVKQTATEMGYCSAKSLAQNKPVESITLIVRAIDFGDTNYHAKIIQGVEAVLKQKNIPMFLTLIDETDTIPDTIKRANGAILLGRIPIADIEKVSALNIPLVLIDNCDYIGKSYDTIMATNYNGCLEATSYAITKGHKKIAFVGSPEYSYSFRERFRGFCDCIELCSGKNLIPCNITDRYDSAIIPCNRTQLMQTLSSKDRPTAFVCANDATAIILYQMAEEMKLSIPNDLSIVGFDNIEKAKWLTPHLSTVSIPMSDMGKAAVTRLLERIENPNSPCQQIQVSTSLKQRDSVIAI